MEMPYLFKNALFLLHSATALSNPSFSKQRWHNLFWSNLNLGAVDGFVLSLRYLISPNSWEGIPNRSFGRTPAVSPLSVGTTDSSIATSVETTDLTVETTNLYRLRLSSRLKQSFTMIRMNLWSEVIVNQKILPLLACRGVCYKI